MKLPCLLQFRILKLAVQSLFSRPYTTRFPEEPFEPVDAFRGRPRYDEAECIGCGACAQVCPSACIDVVDGGGADRPVRRLVHHVDSCIFCGQCERYCTTEKGIRLGREYDCAAFSREELEEESVEKELLTCEGCGGVIAPLDQVRWLVRRLGPLAFTNPTLLLVSCGELAVVGGDVTTESAEPLRSQRVSILCPKCRRKAAFVA